jgi:hypothetical protein
MARTARRYGWTRAATIAVVAYGLVLQALLGAITGSADAAFALGQAPGILCSEHAAPGVPEGSGATHHGMQCCILHGPGLDPMAGPSGGAPVVLPRGPAGHSLSRPVPVELAHRRHGVRPLGARAPPLPV